MIFCDNFFTVVTWEQRKLGDVANVYDGIHTTPDYQNKGVMFLSVENINTLNSQKFVTQDDYLNNYKHKPEFHDIFMTRIGSIGKTNILETHEPRAFYVSLALIKPKNINSYYLKYWLDSRQTQKEICRRTLQIAFPQKINKDEIGKITSFISTNNVEQNNIGKFLSKLDNLILLQQRKYKLNVNLRHNLLNALINYTKINKQDKIKNVATISSKTINPQNFPDNIFREYSMHAYDKNKKPNITLGNSMHSNKLKILGPTILFNKLNVRKNRVWNITKSYNNNICSTEFIPLVTKNINQNYLYFVLQTDYVLYHVISLSTGSSNSQKRITPNDLLNLKIPVPSQEQQERISQILNKLDFKIQETNIKIEQLKKLKRFMLKNIFI